MAEHIHQADPATRRRAVLLIVFALWRIATLLSGQGE
jgi:hypothetical protein